MSYLSQATVPLASALNMRLADGYAWHTAIWESFPGQTDAARDFLFRADRQGNSFRVLLLSPIPPAPTPLLAWNTKPVADSFLGHQRYRFQLKANPTFRRSADGRRLAIYDADRLADWLRRKASDGGFDIIEPFEIGAPLDEPFIKNGHRGKHVAVEFAGALHVTNPTQFADTFYRGIGAAKGFGYGLLMLQPIH